MTKLFQALMAVWPFRDFIERREWRRRDREEIEAATAEFMTAVVTQDGTETGIKYTHVVVFLRDGNGVRYTRVHSPNTYFSDRNSSITIANANWRYHNELPDHADRIDTAPRGKLLMFPGGAP